MIDLPDLGGSRRPGEESPEEAELLRFDEARENLEVRFLIRALNRSRFNRRQAADLLGISYDQFRGLLRKHAGTDRS